MLKMITKAGKTTIIEDGKEMVFTLGEAWHYVGYRIFVALVQGKKISTHRDGLYPVRSLLPPTKRKVVKYYVLEEDAV